MSFRIFGAGILEGAVTVGCTLWSGYAGACAGCCCMLLLKWRALSECFGGGLLVLEGSAWLCQCRVLLQGAGAGCCFRVLSELGCALRSCCRVSLEGTAAGCCFRVLLLELHVGAAAKLLDALELGAGCCCQSAVCAMKLGCWCRCRGWLQDVYGSAGVGP